MFGIFKRNLSLDDISKLALIYATDLTAEFKPENTEMCCFVELEIYIYLYTVVDYTLAMNDFSEKYRRKAFDLFDETAKLIVSGNSKYNEKFITKMFDDRLTNYYEILKFSKKEKSISVLIDYQTQLICSILQSKGISFYNPLPKTPSEYSPIILDLFSTWNIKVILEEYYAAFLSLFVKKVESLKLC